jgi:hypothetical protein
MGFVYSDMKSDKKASAAKQLKKVITREQIFVTLFFLLTFHDGVHGPELTFYYR